MEDEKNLKLAESLIGKNYVEIGEEALKSFSGKIRNILAQRRLPEEGLSDMEIEHFLLQLSAMDTNNFEGKIGVGEREGRIFSNLVQRRNYYMGHGIGRSGTVNAVQPKAPGSSLLLQLAKSLTMELLKNILGLNFVKDLLLVPAATGVSLTLCFLALSKLKPNAKHVLWPRIDQKTCLKSITAAGLIPVVIDEIIENDGCSTNLEEMSKMIEKVGSENILAVFSTTSCFAPRVPDKVDKIAEICKSKNLFHLVNNAYGLQCSKICSMLVAAHQKGKVDLIVQSTDKNFMVPVGGSIIFSSDEKIINSVSSIYPGRASMSPIVDLFITLLSMGRNTFTKLLKERTENFKYFKEKLTEVLPKLGERVLDTPSNKISIAFTIGKISSDVKFKENATFFGSYLFRRRVMGARVVSNQQQKIEGISFNNYGSHVQAFPHLPYITVAAAIGCTRKEIDEFIDILEKLAHQLHPDAAGSDKDKPSKPAKSSKSVSKEPKELKTISEPKELTTLSSDPNQSQPAQQPSHQNQAQPTELQSPPLIHQVHQGQEPLPHPSPQPPQLPSTTTSTSTSTTL